MKFSIIIPAHDEEEYIVACIQAAKHLNYPADDYEIVVVDNNSQDRTLSLAQELGVWVVSEKRLGVGWARRTGTEIAQGDYILQIDADTRLPANYLVEVEKRFAQDKQLVCLGGQMIYYDTGIGINFIRFFIHYLLWFFARVVSGGQVGPMGNNMTFRKKDYQQTTGFDPQLRYGEDSDLCRKLARLGRIKLDMSLKCFVSGRRYRLNRYLGRYFFNFLCLCVGRRPYHNELPSLKKK
ncbi:MAG TPA: glycosyltransferase family 2 protein [Patescibacteria group bacterium]|nr:glycosyltransferase family 2 protein [Patescibacteria group bacterium]